MQAELNECATVLGLYHNMQEKENMELTTRVVQCGVSQKLIFVNSGLQNNLCLQCYFRETQFRTSLRTWSVNCSMTCLP